MRKTILACVGSVLLSALSPAIAADMPVKGIRAPYIAPYYNWTGLYLGINGGYGWGTSNWTNTAGVSTGNFGVKGMVAGGTLGYNFQTGAIVWGVEGDFDWSNIKGSTTVACPGGCETKNSWLGTGRFRIGYAFDRWLPYITGGGAAGDVKMTSVVGSGSQTRFGWTAGAGIEWGFLSGWSAKVEYLYLDLGTANCAAGICGALPVNVKFQTNLVRAGINYRF